MPTYNEVIYIRVWNVVLDCHEDYAHQQARFDSIQTEIDTLIAGGNEANVCIDRWQQGDKQGIIIQLFANQ